MKRIWEIPVYPELAQTPNQHRKAGSDQRQNRNATTQCLWLQGRRISQTQNLQFAQLHLRIDRMNHFCYNQGVGFLAGMVNPGRCLMFWQRLILKRSG